MGLPVLSPLQIPQVDTSRAFGGQVTNLRCLRGFEKADDLDSAFLVLVEVFLALGFAKCQKTTGFPSFLFVSREVTAHLILKMSSEGLP